jgi:FMN reductase [NAD(P)H]
MNISDAIAKRRSIRAYQEKPVPADELDRIIEAGRWAPNAGPFHISVVRNAQLHQRINERTIHAMLHSGDAFLIEKASTPGGRPLYGAPVFILISGPAESPLKAFNASLSAENMLLQATELGLGTCFMLCPTLALNDGNNRDLRRAAGVPDGYVPQCCLVVGYVKDESLSAAEERVPRGTVTYVD